MADLKIEKDKETLAYVVAKLAIMHLDQAIKLQGQASWVLAGGSTPLDAYRILASEYKDALDWSKVWVLLGDERCVAVDSRDSNWGQIRNILSDLAIPEDQKIIPNFDLKGDEAAEYYEKLIMSLSLAPGVPRLNHVWLGMGRDGHTLSLFPGSNEIDSEKMVVAINNAPKPPMDRISLTLKALSNVGTALVIISGEDKARAYGKAMDGGDNLPVMRAVKAIEQFGGKVTYVVDADAAAEVKF
jgi:6-phosphogluconolactonase